MLILEEDLLVAELLETIILGMHTGANIHIVGSVSEAQANWQPDNAAMLICGWKLPDGFGLDFVRHARQSDPGVPVFIVSNSADRRSVRAAAKCRVNGFFLKPLDVSVLQGRLKQVLVTERATGIALKEPGGPEGFFAAAIGGQIVLPTSLDPADVLALMCSDDEASPGQLAEKWRHEKTLVTRLLDVANGSSFRRSGEPVATLRDAIITLGVRMSLNIALSLTLDYAHHLTDNRLRSLAMNYSRMSDVIATEAHRMAGLLGHDASLCFTAGLLGRIGELAALSVLQRFLASGGELTDEAIDRALSQWCQAMGNKLKVQWRLPLNLRDLVGAIHVPSSGSVHQIRLVMRAAALYADGSGADPDYLILMRRLGLESLDRQFAD